MDKIDIENRTFSKITSKGRIDIRLWDSVALKEAVINAIIHNDYSREIPPKFEIFPDRIEITSYGRLFEGMNDEDFFGVLSLPRNKEIMRIYRDLNMAEQLGSGVPRILKSYPKNSFIFGDSYIRMVFMSSEPVYSNTTDRFTQNTTQNTTQKILNLLLESPNLTRKQIAKEIGVSENGVKYQLNKMKNDRLIERKGSDRSGYWVVKN